MDIFYTDTFEWQLYRMFGIWNSAVHEISNWIQEAGTYRSTVVLNRVYKAFFHSEDFLDWAHIPDQMLLAILMLALEIESERMLYLHNEGSETGDDYGLPQPLNKSIYIYSVLSLAKDSFSFTDYQKPMISTSLLNLKWRQVKSTLHLLVHRQLNFNNLHPSSVDSCDDAEKNIPTAPLDDPVRSKEPILGRDLCILWLQTNLKQVILLPSMSQ